jgi:cell division septation protein DedD
MVTAKKTTTAKAAIAAPVKTAAVKNPPAKKAVKAAAPVEVKPTPTAAKPAVKAAAKPKTPAKPKAAPAVKADALSLEQRNHYVQVAAFYIAERRGFAATNPAEDWAAAEAEIDRLIASGQFAR